MDSSRITNKEENKISFDFKSIVLLLIKVRLWFNFRVLFPLKLWLLEISFNFKNFEPKQFIRKLTDRESWKEAFLRAYSRIEDIENQNKNILENYPKFSTAFILILVIGVLPLIWQFSQRASAYFINSKDKKIISSLREAKYLSNNEKEIDANKKYFSAFLSRPKSFKANLGMAIFFLEQNNFKKAEKNILFLSHLYPNRPEVIALKGIRDLHQGKYLRAEDKLNFAHKAGISDDWVIDSYATALVANGKTKQASKLAGWPGDCEANSVSHALCMRRIANWHKEVKDIEIELQRCSTESNKALYHQKREIIFLGESLRTLRRGIQETDGLYKKSLVKQYDSTKKLLKYSHAKLVRNRYLDKSKVAYNELTKPEVLLKI